MSNINYTAINENFPVAGQDNDTQVFRDNFDTIKTNFREAKTEIEDLQDNVARTDVDNEFNNWRVQGARFQNCRDIKFIGTPDTSIYDISYVNGPYQVITLAVSSTTITFSEFPGDSNIAGEDSLLNVGKVTLELYSSEDTVSKEIVFDTGGSAVPKKNTSDAWEYNPSVANILKTTVDSSTDPVFIEVWRHSNDVIYFRHLGQFS